MTDPTNDDLLRNFMERNYDALIKKKDECIKDLVDAEADADYFSKELNKINKTLRTLEEKFDYLQQKKDSGFPSPGNS